MKIVIDIPEEDYKVFVRQYCNDSTPRCRLYKAIKSGVVLPKGHGRIIDEDTIPVEDNVSDIRDDEDGTRTVLIDRDYFPFKAPTIIPKDGDTES
jgi:hypothetical protein